MKNILLYSIITAITFSCQKAIEIDREFIKPKLVINSIISPNSDTVFLSLTESRDLLYDKSSFPTVKTATIQFYEDGIKLGNFIFDSNNYYFVHTVKSGSTYKVEASNTGFDDVKAETTVISKLNATKINGEKLESGKINASIIITDNINEDNFYQVSMKWADITTDSSIINDTIYYYEPYFNSWNCTNDYIVEYPQADAIEGTNCNNIFLFNDITFKNSEHEFKLSSPSNNYYYPQEGYKTNLILEVSSVDYSYYTYIITKSIFEYNFGNPFAEPVQVYSNIENGFGIFGSEYFYSDTLIFE